MSHLLGYEDARARRRVKLMSLANMCSEKQRLTYDEVIAGLSIDRSEVETWVIDGMPAHFWLGCFMDV